MGFFKGSRNEAESSNYDETQSPFFKRISKESQNFGNRPGSLYAILLSKNLEMS
jgi:hypothetical protein